MIDYGGTTPFEVYRPSWNAAIGRNDPVPNTQSGITSLCHPWGAGVVTWLSEKVLGIAPTAPGFATYDIVPHLGGSLTSVRGSTPTPFGTIHASFNRITGVGRIEAPQGTVGRVGVPKCGRTIVRITINGSLAWEKGFHQTTGISGASQDAEFVYFTGLKPGVYSLSTVYAGRSAIALPQKLAYAGRLVRQDSTTRGDWGGVYGQDGQVLFGNGPGGTDTQALPAYVESLDLFRAFPKAGRPDTTLWSSLTSDRRALASDRNNGPSRIASSISNTDQTMTLTVKMRGRGKHRLSLYFVDWQRQGTRTAVELFDAATLRMIAPVRVVSGHGEGKYLVYEVDRSVKFRFDKVRGDLVTLSGLFFDPSPM
jgi:alpha-L-rhamnosidase